MAVRLEGTIKRWIGLSSDVKPAVGRTSGGETIAENDIPAGSSFLETDTGQIWRYNGVDWVVHVPMDDQAALLEGMLSELRQIRELVELNL